jgi:MoCo/4Fe-4S cofactor protein with predicted Tat translocation signal
MDQLNDHRLNLDELRRRLSEASGPKYWRSLEEVADTEEFRAFVEDEFPNRTPDWNNPTSRRKFLTLMGASLALAGASACTKQPEEKIVPYVRQPEEVIPGKPMFYATSMTTAGLATGLLVESHLGRPTKIEGNPDHPASLGATDLFMQASVLTLYDPDRSQTVLHNGYLNSWTSFVAALAAARDVSDLRKGTGFRILTGTVTSPTLKAQIERFLGAFPQAKWHQWEPCGRHADRAGSMAAFGSYLNTVYHFDKAARIVSLDGDFVAPAMPGSLRYMREYSGSRRMAAENASAEAPRLYVAESMPSITGGMAEHRFRMRSTDVEAFAVALAQALKVDAAGQGTAPNGTAGAIQAIAKDLDAHRGSSVVVPGEYQTPRVHALAHALNQALGNTGKTVTYTDRVEANPMDEVASLAELVADINSGAVDTLLILGGNPVFDAPAELNFLDALKKVNLRVHVGLYDNETAQWCHWHVPEAHYLESWSDARAWDGTASIVQPLINPMYQGRTYHEVLNILNKQPGWSSHDTVQDYWRTQHKGNDFEDFWQITLHNGVVAGTAFPEKSPPAAKIPTAPAAATGLEIVFRPDPTIGDGAFSNNAWLQELPKPPNKMTWDNAVWISPKTAQSMGIQTGDVVEMTLGGRKVSGPCWVQPSQADESLTVHFGYGRTRAGQVANGVGFDAYALRTANALWHGAGVSVRKVSSGYSFANTEITQTMEERDPFRIGTLDEYHQDPEFATPAEKHVPPGMTMFPMWQYPDHKWGMSIDLTACTGCNACMVACQSENNIAVVGKEQVAMGRHMNWIRVDRYFKGDLDDPEMYFQPVPCMQCENALCELVCPVAATVHSKEGLNEMVYNRCVGTRYCSNNCPYKVRRFNFLLFSDWQTPSLWGLRNPDVSVRSRGVMEKCSYCVQRIQERKITAEEQNNRPLKDGEIITACQQVCPAQAIVFGDMNDPKSQVAQRKSQKRNYLLLEDLDTRPRTTYLARLSNPNPEIKKG